jgi:carbamoyl-phosphate synthase large subunit
LLPAQNLYVETIRRIKKIARAIAKALNITGPFNIQLMARRNEVKVIECNLRASRSFPFISKTFDFNFISLASLVMAGIPYKTHDIRLMDIDYVGIKAPQFSFTRLQGADPTLGVEMMSTGEVACFGQNANEAFLKSMQASLFKLPPKGGNILLAIGPEKMKNVFLESIVILKDMGFNLYATDGTWEFLQTHGIAATKLRKPSELKTHPTEENVLTLLSDRKIHLTIAIPQGFSSDSVTNGYEIRRTTVDFGISLVTNIQCATLLVASMQKAAANPAMMEIKSVGDYYDESGVLI